MHRIRISRRSFVSSTLAVAGGILLSGCGGEDKEVVQAREANPSEKAKDSMDFYKKNVLKQGAKK